MPITTSQMMPSNLMTSSNYQVSFFVSLESKATVYSISYEIRFKVKFDIASHYALYKKQHINATSRLFTYYVITYLQHLLLKVNFE